MQFTFFSILHRELLNHVEVRPLDYDYLVKLPPGPQRLYELLSFSMYGAISNQRPRAKLIYSDYCLYAPQARYTEFDKVKKQMGQDVVDQLEYTDSIISMAPAGKFHNPPGLYIRNIEENIAVPPTF